MKFKQLLTSKNLLIIALIALTVVIRVSKFVPNVAPVTALAMFGGATLPFPASIILPLAAMLGADAIIGFDKVGITLTIYATFIVISLFGKQLKNNALSFKLIGISLFSSVLFYLTTNAAVWWWGGLYPHTLDGLVLSYWYAIPFFRYTLFGDMAYVGSLFIALEYLPVLGRLVKQAVNRSPKEQANSSII